MIIRAVKAVARRVAGGQPAVPGAGLKSPEQVRHALAVARAVADRTGQVLSVVVFRPRSADTAAATGQVLGSTLRSRLRLTDDAGWLDSQAVCAILPFTPRAGAWRVADDVCLRFPDDLPPPVCEVLTYPAEDASPEGLPADPAEHRRPIEPAAGPGRDGSARPAAPLGPVFLHKMSPAKRAVDVVGAAVGIALLLPLLPAVAAAIKLSSRGPVFFKQRRTGWGGRPFQMWKFRTMVADAEARQAELLARNERDGPAFKLARDPRVTAVGRFLRCTSLDELPQLWNVLRGEMSLVGPRPLPVAEAGRCERWHGRRLDAVPGLTCIWQVRKGTTVTFDEWVRMDIEYIATQSLGRDLGLIAQTVPVMVLRKGAN